MQDDLKRLNETWNRAWLEKDVATVERLMSPEYVYVAPNGDVLNRAALLEIIRSPRYHISWGTRTEVEIRPLRTDAGIVLHRWQGEGSYEGRPFKDDHRCTRRRSWSNGQSARSQRRIQQVVCIWQEGLWHWKGTASGSGGSPRRRSASLRTRGH
jgi:hypothetical protein